MAQAPDSTLLSDLSLPGTHNTCALHNGLSFGFARCQAWDLAGQLKAGIRFIDIRCRHLNDTLLIYHGPIGQKISFKKVRDICSDFLEKHPSECIVMSIKEESTASGNSQTFAETFNKATSNDGDLWRIGATIPTLGSARKKIVLIDRVGDLGGVPWKDIVLQDQYQAPVASKAKLIRAHFAKTIKSRNSAWHINFCSGTLPASLLTPARYAILSNQVAVDFIRQLPAEPVCIGTVVMDFPGEAVIEEVISTNFQPPAAPAGRKAPSRKAD